MIATGKCKPCVVLSGIFHGIAMAYVVMWLLSFIQCRSVVGNYVIDIRHIILLF